MGQRHTTYGCDSAKEYWKRQYLQHSKGKILPRDLTPLRYPGGKGSLKYFLANTVKANGLEGGILIEPFCGGSGASMPLLEAGVIGELYINDANPAVAAFWQSLFLDTDSFVTLVDSTPITIDQWHRWREVMLVPEESSTLELGFATFFMNRCNRSGLLSSGPIGGFDQLGNYKIDCRFNRVNLIKRIETIAKHREKVTVSNSDACDFLQTIDEQKRSESLIFIDPPYVGQGKNLYKKYSFGDQEHMRFADFIKPKNWKWLITYDDHPLIHKLYAERALGVIEFSYLMQQAKIGRELLVASSHCRIPLPDQKKVETQVVESELIKQAL